MGAQHHRLWRLIARALRPAGGSCRGPSAAPPCAPCPPRTPPCRQRQPDSPSAVRTVCCPPRREQPSPCMPTATTRTCADITNQDSKSCSVRCVRSPPCRSSVAGNLDVVAQRLARAKHARQMDYEREVAQRPAAASCRVPSAPYELGNEREVALATDGRLYALPRKTTKRPRCNEDGTPQPPRTFSLDEPVTECRLGDSRLDYCGHQPRVFVEIDRSETKPDRILSSSTPPGEVTCKRSERRTGNSKWCSDPLPAADLPQRCRPLTVVERLRSRPHSVPRRPNGGCDTRKAPGGGSSQRHLHTSARARSATSIPKCSSPPAQSSTRRETIYDCKNADSWFSMKNIIKKITGCSSPKPTSTSRGVKWPVAEVSHKPSQNRNICTPPATSAVPITKKVPPPPCGKTTRCLSTARLFLNTVIAGLYW